MPRIKDRMQARLQAEGSDATFGSLLRDLDRSMQNTPEGFKQHLFARANTLLDTRGALRSDNELLNFYLQDATGQRIPALYGDKDLKEARDLNAQLDRLIGDVARAYERVARKLK